jgi:hypothetical protein
MGVKENAISEQVEVVCEFIDGVGFTVYGNRIRGTNTSTCCSSKTPHYKQYSHLYLEDLLNLVDC